MIHDVDGLTVKWRTLVISRKWKMSIPNIMFECDIFKHSGQRKIESRKRGNNLKRSDKLKCEIINISAESLNFLSILSKNLNSLGSFKCQWVKVSIRSSQEEALPNLTQLQ